MTEPLRSDDWAGEMGERWLANLDRFESMMEPVGDALLMHAGFEVGERVLDIGCGGGGTTFAIARAVAPSGHVLGLDVSPVLVAEARRRVRAQAAQGIDFVVADASCDTPVGAPFDRVFSRFGVMFFGDAPKAFSHISSLVKPGGRFDFACWTALAENPWMGALADVVRQHIDLPPPPAGVPGPFSLADEAQLRALLQGSGWTGIHCRRWQGPQWLGGKGADARTAADFALQSMSFGRVVKALDAPLRGRIDADIVRFLEQHRSSAGIALDAAAWLVTARRP
jgi:SAM-dependent methyltransferase